MEVYYYKVLTRYMKQHIICDVKDLYYTCFKKKLLGGWGRKSYWAEDPIPTQSRCFALTKEGAGNSLSPKTIYINVTDFSCHQRKEKMSKTNKQTKEKQTKKHTLEAQTHRACLRLRLGQVNECPSALTTNLTLSNNQQQSIARQGEGALSMKRELL